MHLLLARHHVNDAFQLGIIFQTLDRQIDVLRHVQARPVPPHDGLVGDPVFLLQRRHDRPVVRLGKKALLQSLLHDLLPVQVDLGLVIVLIELCPHACVRLEQSFFGPGVHLFP